MEEEMMSVPDPNATVEVVDIQFRPGQKVYYFDPAGIACRVGDHLIIETARGPEYGICTGENHTILQRDVVAPLRCVLRLATAQDECTVAENRAKEKRAYEVCQQKILDHHLDMQLVSAEYAFDGSKILFFFTADERVDFRELVKNLAGIFHTRIELRQIGVRDKAKMVGGLGICGRPFCCASFLDDFQPVSIKMAKTQNLSLNPTKISGTCGRLMCCLKYEQDTYEDLLRRSPKMDSLVDTPDGRGTVVEVDLLRQRVKVRLEQQPETITSFANEDIAVLRNGRAKKNENPIPDDLAPISGSGTKPRKAEQEDEPVLLDPIRFRYSTESIVDEPGEDITAQEKAVLPEQPADPEEKPVKNRRRSRRVKPVHIDEKSVPKTDGKTVPNTESDEKEQMESERSADSPPSKKRPHRRSNYRHSRKSKMQGENPGASTGE